MRGNKYFRRYAWKTVLLLLVCTTLSIHSALAGRLHASQTDRASIRDLLFSHARTPQLTEDSITSLPESNPRPSFLQKQYAEQQSKRPRRKAPSWAELQKRYPGSFVIGGPRGERKVALTFDDVPDPRFTPQILDILARYKVRATFFVVGSRASKHPSMVKRIGREGHIIGNHSYNHAVFSRISLPAFQQQVLQTDAILRPLAGYSPRLIRPPYGEILPEQIVWMKRNGYIAVNWDVDSSDWRGIDSNKVLLNIKKTLQPGSIVLQHAGGGTGQNLSGTIEALPRLIKLLRSKGYQIVTLPDLLSKPAARSTEP
ncbi:polysaccharide deacetylase family protein [Paenibacillus nasutitermitis]|uniref:Polysaccharide deacetylase n=1 Tax=Paenibacillus nasutitermitis TaxID=1652958 RepID=A0A916Z448_9BACL|nr:polysaccharide deacetylase family protein [Paenibacillus nasutitermitis]GGD75507.1 polysaccharide deacetylase [Paenibacillus nasutitermitis]